MFTKKTTGTAGQRICFLILPLIIFSLGSEAFANTNLQQELIDLRAEVQLQADHLDSEKKSIQSSIQSLTVEKGELESQKKLLSQANLQFEKALKEKQKIMGGEELKDFKGYADMANLGAGNLFEHFEKSVPFKVGKRKERLRKLQKKFENKELTVAEYFEKYWSVLQDEIRLSESVEVQSDNISIEGTDYKVKVLKLGMAGLYFKTHDGRLGYALKQESSWTFKFFEEASLSKGVSLLFAAKEKQIKGGRFELPLMISSEVNDVL